MMMGGGDGGAGNTNQFIGSKISLISKSEIRYEGILYSLDLEEATISLQKVRSFGTEDRATTRPVLPKDEVYEFIIFRGADIKGIDVLEPPPPGKEVGGDEEPIDPAIVEVQHYQPQAPQQQQQQQPPQQQPQQQAQQPTPIGSLGGMNNHNDRFGNNFVGIGPPSGSNSGIGHHMGGPAGIHQGHSLGVGFGNNGAIGGAVGQSVAQQQRQQPQSPPVQNRDIPAKSLGSPPTPDQQGRQKSHDISGSNNRRSYAPRGRGGGGGGGENRGGLVNNIRGGGIGGGIGGGGIGGGGGLYNPRGRNPNYNNAYTNYNRYAANGGQGPPRNYFRRGELKGNKKLTFDGEFDFEKANEELQKALMKIKIADGGKEDGEEDEVHHEEDRASEDGEGSVDKENESKNFYSKDNFFDSISCEALERKSGKREKPDWRAERKLNAETFGIPLNAKPSTRGGGSSTYYRGGGYHHNNYNSYNNYRGGYGGYRGGGGGYRGGGGGHGGYRGGGPPRGGYSNRSRGGGVGGDRGGIGGGSSSSSAAAAAVGGGGGASKD